MKPLVFAFFLLGLSACWDNSGQSSTSPIPPTRVGDYLTLVLSWSPSYCLTEAGGNDRQQCGLKANDGRRYSFVVHGLWPQYDTPRGDQRWPEYCLTPAPWIEDTAIETALSSMPTRKLVIHQWKKHGTCYSKSPDAYVDALQHLFNSITIPGEYLGTTSWLTLSPDKLRQTFLSSNPQLSSDMILVQCGNRRDRARLKDIRICFSKSGQPRACGTAEKRQCRATKLVLPPVRN